MPTRTYTPRWLRWVQHPLRTAKRSMKRAARRPIRRAFGKRTHRPAIKYRSELIRKDGWDSIRPGRTIVEWLPHPEVGRGLVLAFLPGRTLDVEFEGGVRLPYGIEIEDIRVLAK